MEWICGVVYLRIKHPQEISCFITSTRVDTSPLYELVIGNSSKVEKKFVLFCNNAFSDFFSFLNSGTTYHGQWDGWYGPDGRKGRPYNYNLVYNSPAAKGLKSIGMSVPNKSKIDELRSETQLHCEKPKNAGNCDPSFQVCLFNITADPCELNNLAFKVGEMSIVFVKCV